MNCLFQIRAASAIMLFLMIGFTYANPQLTPGVWKNIGPTPPNPSNPGPQGIAIDPNNPSTLYVNIPGAVFKSIDGGSNWNKIGNIDCANHIYIDPNNSNHLIASDGVCGGTGGFWVSTNGGNNWTIPAGFDSAAKKIGSPDLYCLAVDPTDFNHILMSYHWTPNSYPGVVESFDDGGHCIVHPAIAGNSGGAGYNVYFLYYPSIGIGDSHTWFFTTQAGGTGTGWWLTTNSGADWKHVCNEAMPHGGYNGYCTKAGVLYWGADNGVWRSFDKGQTWTQIPGLPSKFYYTVVGDGTYLYICQDNFGNGGSPYITSLETDGLKWTPYNNSSQTFTRGPFQSIFDPKNRIIYACHWEQGLFALRVIDSPVNTHPPIVRLSAHTISRISYTLKLFGNGKAGQINSVANANMIDLYDVKGQRIKKNQIYRQAVLVGMDK